MASSSWRISVNEVDRSQVLVPEAGTTGAMAIRASRGPDYPVFISPRQANRITALYGNATKNYPDVWEALEYNKVAPLWIVAPHDSTDTIGGVLITSNGAESLQESEAPTQSEIDNESFTFADGTEYFALFAKSPKNTDDISVIVSYESSTGLFTVELYQTDNDGQTWNLVNTYTVSPIPGKKDGFGQNVFVEDVFENNDYVQALANDEADLSNDYPSDDTRTRFVGGSRTDATASDLETAFDYFKQARKYSADLFMSPVADEGTSDIVGKFDELRNNHQKWSFYLMPLPMGEDVSTAISTKEGYSVNNDGLALYWNHGQVRDSVTRQRFWTSLVGRIGTKHAEMEDVFNGLAPMWVDGGEGHGGQLGPGIIKLEYDPTEAELEQLDNAGINPVVFDPAYGTMIVSQKTAQTPTNLSDTSYIGHRRLFDYIIDNVVTQVLPFQIGKLNDEFHRNRVASQTRSLVNPIITEGLLRNARVICDRSNNTDEVLSQRKFILTVYVQVTTFSEEVKLEFVNVGQNIDVEEITG